MSPTRARSRIFYGWRVVIACALVAVLSSASRFSFTMYFPSMLDDLHWTRATLGFGMTLHMWVYAFGAIAAGALVDRFGARPVMAVGGALILVGLAVTSRISTLWQFYVGYGVVLAAGVSATLAVPGQSAARKWFVRRAGLATSFVSGGIGIGMGVVALVSPSLIQAYGWRASWMYIGVFIGIAVVLLSIIFVRKDPESLGLLPDGDGAPPEEWPGARDGSFGVVEDAWSVREALWTRSYWCLILAYGLVGFNYGGIGSHMAAWGMDVARASAVPPDTGMAWTKTSIFLMAIASLAGGFVGGPLSDRVGRKPVFSLGLGLATGVWLYAVAVRSLVGVALVGGLSGFFMGLCAPLWTAYLGDIFGRASLATLFGVLAFTMGIIGGLGAFLFGWIFDATGSYAWAWVLTAFSTVTILLLVLFTRRETRAIS